MTTLKEINKEFDDKSGKSFAKGGLLTCDFDEPFELDKELVKDYYSSQIRALLEGLKMEKNSSKQLEFSSGDRYYDEAVSLGFNEAVELFNQKISSILGENYSVLEDSDKTDNILK